MPTVSACLFIMIPVFPTWSNKNGDVLIRSPHINSNKTMKNLFDMLPKAQNDSESLKRFADSLKQQRRGGQF